MSRPLVTATATIYALRFFLQVGLHESRRRPLFKIKETDGKNWWARCASVTVHLCRSLLSGNIALACHSKSLTPSLSTFLYSATRLAITCSMGSGSSDMQVVEPPDGKQLSGHNRALQWHWSLFRAVGIFDFSPQVPIHRRYTELCGQRVVCRSLSLCVKASSHVVKPKPPLSS